MKIKVIVTGSTGMVGKGVLLECLESDDVESVLVINRRSLEIDHPKLKEIIHTDFFDLRAIENELKNYDACFYCLGISSAGLSEEKYTRITYGITKEFADTLFKLNPSMVFNYVSGQGTDSSEKGKTMWARVKGKTENMLLQMKFKDAYMFRPGLIIPEKGIKSGTALYNVLYLLLRPFFGVFRKMNSVTTTTAIGQAMIHSVFTNDFSKKILDGPDINILAKRKNEQYY